MNSRHGFSLLEVLIALLILGVGVMAVMQLFPPSLYQARLSTERVPTAAWADRELNILRSWGLALNAGDTNSPGMAMPWPVDYTTGVQTAWGNMYLQYNIQSLGVPDVVRKAGQIYYMYRVTLAVPMIDGRYEKFVTYISKY
jgi:prepilin-type N-terminal cleavage/methylation domain-containing protein